MENETTTIGNSARSRILRHKLGLRGGIGGGGPTWAGFGDSFSSASRCSGHHRVSCGSDHYCLDNSGECP